jgi:putative ABC transport system permease protein
MVKNYLRLAWRNLVKYKLYSFINITGLSIGLAVCMLIVLYVQHESSYDSFHTNANRIFWVQAKLNLGADSVFLPYLSYSAAPAVRQREPSVESFLRIRNSDQNTTIQNPQKPTLKFTENKFLFADSNFFNFFSFQLLKGNKDQALLHPLSVVISKDAAKKYFGTEDAVGKRIRYNNSYDFVVRGISENSHSNSTIQYDFVASISSLQSITELQDLIKRDKNDFTTYFLIKPTGNIAKVETTLSQLSKEQNDDQNISTRFISIPLTKLHTTSNTDNSNLKYLKIFPFVAALILLLAIINYVSLSTARSAIRAKEIGVRKVMGADGKMIAVQFFTESALYTFLAFACGYGLCILFQPLFFDFLQINIDHAFLYHPVVLWSYAGIFAVTMIISAAYPSMLLSAFRPVLVLYGKFKQQGGVTTRKIFTVFQFSIAVVFIICGIVIQKQMHLFRHMDTGINRENVIMLPFGSNAGKHFLALKNDIRNIAGVSNVSTALHPMFKGYDMMGIMPPGAGQKMMLVPTLDVDQDFISMLGLKWKQQPADSFYYKSKNAVLLNEAAVQKLDLQGDLRNKKVDQFEIAGVLKDFNWSSLQNEIAPLFITVQKDVDSNAMWAGKGGCLFAKIHSGTNIPTLIDQVKNIQKKYDSDTPFEYYFMNDAFDALYKAEDRLAKILAFLTGLAVAIACFGLLGLVTFMAMQRTKEIGIRKTLGASAKSIVQLLSADFVKLVLVAVIIASPVAWYFMNNWLRDFAYRVSIEWWVFVCAAGVAIMITFITLSFQVLKAALSNPVKSLRTE